jgi:hypothetical protein
MCVFASLCVYLLLVVCPRVGTQEPLNRFLLNLISAGETKFVDPFQLR